MHKSFESSGGGILPLPLCRSESKVKHAESPMHRSTAGILPLPLSRGDSNLSHVESQIHLSAAIPLAQSPAGCEFEAAPSARRGAPRADGLRCANSSERQMSSTRGQRRAYVESRNKDGVERKLYRAYTQQVRFQGKAATVARSSSVGTDAPQTEVLEGSQIRPKALHFHNIHGMESEDIVAYCATAPAAIEWFAGRNKCNVCFRDNEAARICLVRLAGHKPAPSLSASDGVNWYNCQPFTLGGKAIKPVIRLATTGDIPDWIFRPIQEKPGPASRASLNQLVSMPHGRGRGGPLPRTAHVDSLPHPRTMPAPASVDGAGRGQGRGLGHLSALRLVQNALKQAQRDRSMAGKSDQSAGGREEQGDRLGSVSVPAAPSRAESSGPPERMSSPPVPVALNFLMESPDPAEQRSCVSLVDQAGLMTSPEVSSASHGSSLPKPILNELQSPDVDMQEPQPGPRAARSASMPPRHGPTPALKETRKYQSWPHSHRVTAEPWTPSHTSIDAFESLPGFQHTPSPSSHGSPKATSRAGLTTPPSDCSRVTGHDVHGVSARGRSPVGREEGPSEVSGVGDGAEPQVGGEHAASSGVAEGTSAKILVTDPVEASKEGSDAHDRDAHDKWLDQDQHRRDIDSGAMTGSAKHLPGSTASGHGLDHKQAFETQLGCSVCGSSEKAPAIEHGPDELIYNEILKLQQMNSQVVRDKLELERENRRLSEQVLILEEYLAAKYVEEEGLGEEELAELLRLHDGRPLPELDMEAAGQQESSSEPFELQAGGDTDDDSGDSFRPSWGAPEEWQQLDRRDSEGSGPSALNSGNDERDSFEKGAPEDGVGGPAWMLPLEEAADDAATADRRRAGGNETESSSAASMGAASNDRGPSVMETVQGGLMQLPLTPSRRQPAGPEPGDAMEPPACKLSPLSLWEGSPVSEGRGELPALVFAATLVQEALRAALPQFAEAVSKKVVESMSHHLAHVTAEPLRALARSGAVVMFPAASPSEIVAAVQSQGPLAGSPPRYLLEHGSAGGGSDDTEADCAGGGIEIATSSSDAEVASHRGSG